MRDITRGACATAHDNVLSAHDRPTTMHNVVNYLGHCSWTLFTNTIHGHCKNF